MELVIKDADKILLTVMIKKFKLFNNSYLEAGRQTMLRWYNQESNRNVCIRTLDYMIARLKSAEMIGRQSRTKDDGVVGKQFDTSLTFILKKGLNTLSWLGVAAYDIISSIKASPNERKKRARKDLPQRARWGSTAPMGEGDKRVNGLDDGE